MRIFSASIIQLYSHMTTVFQLYTDSEKGPEFNNFANVLDVRELQPLLCRLHQGIFFSPVAIWLSHSAYLPGKEMK